MHDIIDYGFKNRQEYIRSRTHADRKVKRFAVVVGIIFIVGLAVASFFIPSNYSYVSQVEAHELSYEVVTAYVTGYNLVPSQTDSTPCIGASGKNLCGRRDTMACPRAYAFGTAVEVDGRIYSCEDRLHKKYDDRFDVNCDKDVSCPAQVTGIKSVKIYR